MASGYLHCEEKVSAIARCLRQLRNLDRVSVLMLALKHEFPLVDVERLIGDALIVERARRSAMGRA